MSLRRAIVCACALATMALAPTAAHAAGTGAIHPGVQTFTDGAQCTANFIYSDGTSTYVGQAAHCSGTGGNTATDGCSSGTLPVGTQVQVTGANDPATMVYNSWATMQANGEKDVDTCAYNDIALLKLSAGDLPTVAVGDSSRLKPGQWVVAIGSPFNFDHSVTHGVVSYVGRGFGGADQQYVPFIQTDVPINRGNSGGPLFNLDGQVVGINSQIFSNTGSSVGISFAIPINIAMSAVDQLKTTGHVARGMIGVQIQNIDRAMAQSLGLPRSGGALVNKITPGSGADKADVHVGDVILAYDGHDIELSSDLPPLVGSTKPGNKAELKLYRDGKTMAVPVVVGAVPENGKQLASLERGEGKTGNALGVVVDSLNAEQRKQLKLKDEQGVVITDIRGAARRSPLQPGDVVLMVGRKSVQSSGDFNDAVKDVKPGDSVMLLVRREDVTQFVAVTVPTNKG